MLSAYITSRRNLISRTLIRSKVLVPQALTTL